MIYITSVTIRWTYLHEICQEKYKVSGQTLARTAELDTSFVPCQ